MLSPVCQDERAPGLGGSRKNVDAISLQLPSQVHIQPVEVDMLGLLFGYLIEQRDQNAVAVVDRHATDDLLLLVAAFLRSLFHVAVCVFL